MPYQVKKRKCKDSKGRKGKYVITKKGDNEKISCHTSKEKAQAATRARYASESHEDSFDVIVERVFSILLIESNKKKRKYAGSHPDEFYLIDWHDFDEEWFDKKGITTWDEDREWTKQYLKDIGLLK